jgi:hypothetical protein
VAYLQRANHFTPRALQFSRGGAQKGKISTPEHNCICMANEMLDALICLQPIALTQQAHTKNVMTSI